MSQNTPIYTGYDAVSRLVEYCSDSPVQQYTLVSDTNTYRALGEKLEDALKQAGLHVASIVLDGDEVIADEEYLMQVMIQAPPGEQVFIAVGSGTLTDIARYVSFRTGNTFISTPTAPSVDGFLSKGAPLVIRGVKDTHITHGPRALFADLQTLIDAPPELRAAGFGDVVGKITSLADWKLGQLLWDEPFDAEIERRVRRAMANCFESSDSIASGSENGIRTLFEGLIETGLCMLDLGNSRPASGSEHHCSHNWEMQLLAAGKPAILHGAKVGYATSLIAKLYEKIRSMTQDDARQLTIAARFAGHEPEIAEIRHAYGTGADQVIAIQQPFLSMTEDQYHQLQQRIIDNWPGIQAAADTVLPSSTIAELLDSVGAPTDWKTVGLEAEMIEPALTYGHYLRNRFTVLKLCKMLGIDVRQVI